MVLRFLKNFRTVSVDCASWECAGSLDLLVHHAVWPCTSFTTGFNHKLSFEYYVLAFGLDIKV